MLYSAINMLKDGLREAGHPNFHDDHLIDWECTVCCDVPEREPGERPSRGGEAPKDWEFAAFGCGCNAPICCYHAGMQLNGGDDRCPTCRQPGTLSGGGMVIKDHSKERLYLQTQIECPLAGCDFKGKPFELISHLKRCTKLPCRCPMHKVGCTWVGPPEELEAHMSDPDHNPKTLMYIAQSLKETEQLQGEVKRLREGQEAADRATAEWRASTDRKLTTLQSTVDSFVTDMSAYMEGNGKSVAQANTNALDKDVRRACLDKRKRERAFWGIPEEGDGAEVEYFRQRALRQRLDVDRHVPRDWRRGDALAAPCPDDDDDDA